MTIQQWLHLDSRQGRKKPPVLLGLRSAKWFIITTVCIAVFTDIFLYGLIVPVIPFALTKRVGIPKDQAQHWVSVLLAVYGAGLLAASPLFGWFADRTASRRFPLLLGLIALAGSTLMLCFGKVIGLLVAGRLLQGVSAAMVWTVGLALLVDTVGQDSVGEIMGYVSIAMAMGILVAPILGGIVYDRAGYYSVFAMAYALIALDIVLRLALVEKKVAVQWDVKEDVESPVEEKPPNGDDQTRIPDSSINQTSGTQASEIPLPDGQRASKMKRFISRLPPVITLLSSRRLLAALWGCMVQAALMTSFDSVLPLYVNRIFGYTSTGAGLLFLAIVVPTFIAPLVGKILVTICRTFLTVPGWLSDKHGPRWLATSGFIFGLPFYVLLRFVDHDSIKQKVLLCALLALIGRLPLNLSAAFTNILRDCLDPRNATPDGRGNLHRRRQGKKDTRTLWTQWSLCSGLWAFQHGFCSRDPCWSSLVRVRRAEGRLGHYGLDFGLA
jgi:MFS family permease